LQIVKKGGGGEKARVSPGGTGLLGTVGSYGDTLTDETVLADLKRFHEKGTSHLCDLPSGQR
jgi:hypothetical protein